MAAPVRALLLSVSLLGGAAACQKEAKPPPPPKKCGKVERGTDRIVDVVMCAEADGDEDGVDDAVDLCLEHKETANGVADKDGCPDPDRDRDLFVDYEDTCPDEAGVAPDGCPGKDSDGDLIADHLDSCPHEKEDLDGDQDDDGCPDGARVETVTKALDQQLWQRARVDVVRGKARASKDGERALVELVQEVSTRPADVARVRIVGYAALREVRRGKAKELAKERVKLVEARLAATGIEAAAFERAIYPLPDRRAKTGRVDVMVFLDLQAAMAKRGGDDTSEEQKSGDVETPPAEKKPEDAAKPSEQTPAAEEKASPPVKDRRDDDWDEAAVEPYPEPQAAPAEEDWDLSGAR